MESTISIRKVGEEEHLIRFFFYHSIFVAPGQEPYPEDIVERPELKKYYHNWGKSGDLAFSIQVNQKDAGLCWCRYFSEDEKGYGYISANIPELGVSVLSEYRGRGLGTLLLKKLIGSCESKNIPALSLSVDKINPAVKLYKRLGFQIVKENDHDFIMLLQLAPKGS